MANLTKKHRLIWDISTLTIDPSIEYSPNCVTITNSPNFFESNVIEDIIAKISELGLKYEDPEKPIKEDI